MIRILATGLAACSLAACVSVLPEPKVPEGLYRFAPMETVYDLEDSVIVREPDASRLVAGRAIASEDSSGALRLVPNVEWTDSSTRLMQMAMLDALQGQGAGKAIAPETGAAAPYELSWQVTDFTLSGTSTPPNPNPSQSPKPDLAAFHLVERHVLVDADILGQAQNAFGNDVLQDLVRAARNPQARGPHEALLEDGIGRHPVGICQDAVMVLHLDGRVTDILKMVRGDDLADRVFRSRCLAA